MVLSCEEYRDQQQLLALKKRLSENKLDPEEREEIERLVQDLEIIDRRINNATVRVKKGGAWTAGCIRAKDAARQPVRRFRRTERPSSLLSNPDGHWPKYS